MKTWLIALVLVITAGCTGGVQSSESSATSFLVSTSSATTVVPTTVVKTTIPQTTTSQTPTSTVPGCEIFTDSICPSNGVDPRLACLPNCNGVDFTGMVAPGLDFSDFSFEGANFTDANLIGSWGQYTNFQDAIFADADLSKSYFNGMCFPEKMRRVNFNEAEFYKVCFDGSDLSGASFINAYLKCVDFLEAILKGVNFSGATSPIADETSEGMYGISFGLSKIEGVIPSDDFGPPADSAHSPCDP